LNVIASGHPQKWIIPASASFDSPAEISVIARLPWQPWRSRSNISELALDCFASLAMTEAAAEWSKPTLTGITHSAAFLRQRGGHLPHAQLFEIGDGRRQREGPGRMDRCKIRSPDTGGKLPRQANRQVFNILTITFINSLLDSATLRCNRKL
jgi:hypothetical protein